MAAQIRNPETLMPETARRSRSRDIRSYDLEPLTMTKQQNQQLNGLLCVRCAGTGILQDAGYAYTRDREGGRLGWRVKACPPCLAAGGAW
ncbi:hypothetical protein [Streptomyces sp. NPDC054863]